MATVPTRADASRRPAADREASPRPAPVGGRAARRRDPLFRFLERSVVRRLITFAAIGIVSTAAYALLYAVVRGYASATVSNFLALVVTAIGNTAANRRLTFGVRGRETVLRDQLAGLFAFCVALAITTGSIALLHRLAPDAGRALELSVLLIANGLATVARFVLLSTWFALRPARVPDPFEGSPS
jgi:putative flippase GtrA